MKTAASYIKNKYDCYKGYSEESIREVCHIWCEVIEEAQNDVKKEYEDKIQKQNEILLKITGWDQPYNLTEILSRLVFATDYLLHVKDYDSHNHEELNQSIDRAKEILQFLETREAHFL